VTGPAKCSQHKGPRVHHDVVENENVGGMHFALGEVVSDDHREEENRPCAADYASNQHTDSSLTQKLSRREAKRPKAMHRWTNWIWLS